MVNKTIDKDSQKCCAPLINYFIGGAHMNGVAICHSIITAVNDRISKEDFMKAHRIAKAFTRKRKLSFKKVFLYLLNTSKKSMPIDIADFREDFPELEFPDVTKQAVSKARKGISHEAFAELFRITVSEYYRLKKKRKLWNGYQLFAIDGSDLQLPQTSENEETFGATYNQSSHSFAMASTSILYDLMNDIVVDAQLTSFHYGERKMALLHLEELKTIGMPQNSVFICDRGYPSYELYRSMEEAGAYFVFRLSGNNKVYSALAEEGICDYIPRDMEGKTVKIRTIKVLLDTGTVETLVTNLLETQLTDEQFKQMYALRWGIEGKYLELKERLEIEEFSGSRSSSIKQDFFISMFKSNLTAILKADADHAIEEAETQKKTNYNYQANRSFLINRVHKHLVRLLMEPQKAYKVLSDIVKMAKKIRSQIQPDRKCERKHRQLRRKHHNNRKPCL